jgi:hypothetical protein
MLLAFAAVVLIPIALLALGIRQDITRRLTNEYQVRVDSVVEVIGEDLGLESAGISERLGSLKNALLNDQRFRLAVAGLETEQGYLRNYAANAMRLTGLSLLHIQDGDGRIISAGSDRDLLALGLSHAPGPRSGDRRLAAVSRWRDVVGHRRPGRGRGGW